MSDIPDFEILGVLSAAHFLTAQQAAIASEWFDGPNDEVGAKTFLRRVTVPRLKTLEERFPGTVARIKESLQYHLKTRDFPIEDVYEGGEPVMNLPDDPYRYYEWAWDVLFAGEDWRVE